MRSALLTVFWLLLLNFAKGQEKTTALKADLRGAPSITVNQKYSFKKPPSGYGNIKEFKIDPGRSNAFFKEERNSAWFIIEIPFSGTFSFDLSPYQIKDDYDWMLFKYSSDLDKELRKESASLLRSNNARNATAYSSKTGMGKGAHSNFVKPGPGNNYSSILKVNTGEKFALIVDNIYGGKGFDLFITLKPEFEIPFVSLEGTTKDRYSKKNVSAEVTVEDDSTGLFIAKVTSDPVSGKYHLKVPLNRPLNITAWNPAYLFVTTDTIVRQSSELNFLLDTPTAGHKLVLNNIHFYPNKDEILPSSMPELERLLIFMKERPDWIVKITGHSNTNVFASARYLQELSFNRALAVKNFLTKNAIPEKRISCAGVGGKTPLIVTNDPKEGLKNLRVEVTLVKRQ